MKSVGLVLALAGLSCPVAVRRACAQEGPAPSRGTNAAPRSLVEAEQALRAETSPRPGRVEFAGFQTPSGSLDGADARKSRLPDRPGSSAPSGATPPVPSAPPEGPPPIPLGPRSRSHESGAAGRAARSGGLPSLITVGSSLALVLGLFLVVAWLMRRSTPGGSLVLPGEVVEVLGRAALAGRAQVHLLRCGSKLLLVSMSTAGVETLTEVTDPDEVTRLVGLCRQAQPGSTTAAFRQVLQQLARTPADSARTGIDDRGRMADAGVPPRSDATWEGRHV